MTALSRSRLAAEEALLDRSIKAAEAGEMLNINDLKKAYEEESAIRPAQSIYNLLGGRDGNTRKIGLLGIAATVVVVAVLVWLDIQYSTGLSAVWQIDDIPLGPWPPPPYLGAAQRRILRSVYSFRCQTALI